LYAVSDSLEPNQVLGLGNSAIIVLFCMVALVCGMFYGFINLGHIKDKNRNLKFYQRAAGKIFFFCCLLGCFSLFAVFINTEIAFMTMEIALATVTIMGFVVLFCVTMFLVLTSKTFRNFANRSR
jgi:hypothetical protein